MEAIFDRDGRAVGWRRRDAVFDARGRARAFIRTRALFTYGGRYLGPVEDGCYRDVRGDVVAFEEGATGGPLPPAIERGAVSPQPELPPPTPAVPPAASLAMRPRRWSELAWEEFLTGTVRAPSEARG